MKRIAAIFAAVALTVSVSACSYDGGSDAQKSGQADTEQAYEQQSKAVPYPVDELKDSLERRNLREKLLRTNDPDKIGYVYLMNFGEVFGYYTIKGKVSSTQSQMTTDTVFADGPDDGSREKYPVTAPGDDGSYGENEDGIFFFTNEGAYVTTNMDYIYSDQPIPFDVPELNKN